MTNPNYKAKKVVQITITETDGTVLDRFDLAHWRFDHPALGDDAEACGSSASDSLLLDRIKRYVKEVK